MKIISYILLFIAAVTGLIGLILYLDDQAAKKVQNLDSLEKARKAKAKKAKIAENHVKDPEGLLDDLKDEIIELENLKSDASKKEEID